MSSPVPCSAWAAYAALPLCVQDLHSEADWCGYLATATDIIWGATGRRWRGASTSETVRLRSAPPRPGERSWPYHASWGRCGCYLGIGVDLLPRWSAGMWQHTAPAAIRLPRSDVTAVTTVLMDGAVFTRWALDGSWLARTDGGTWPVCQDRTSVTYLYGRVPPIAGIRAVVELATELGRAASSDPDQPCQLPKRLQAVTRQGITFATLDDMEFLAEGLTGLYAVDLFIRSVNPKGRAEPARCWSPDLPYARRTS